MKKRVLSLLLAAVMLLGALPAGAAEQNVTQVRQWNIALTDRISANFRVEIPTAASEVSIAVTVSDETETYPVTEVDEKGTFCVSAQVAAAQLTESITLQLVADGVEYDPVSYTVRDYAVQLLQSANIPYALKSLVKHILNYGTAAQNYFGVNLDAPANEGNVMSYTAQYPDDSPQPEATGGISGLQFYGATLVMESQVALRYYFTADTLEGIVFTANGSAYTPVKNGEYYYVEIPGILPQNYNQPITLSAQKGDQTVSVSYSPLAYMVRMSQKGNTKTQDLVNAMYGYHRAVLTYVESFAGVVVLPNTTNGTVTADKTSYTPGDTVTLTVTPDAGYSQKLYINGEELLLDWKTNTYSFVATEEVYAVTGSFEPSVSEAPSDAARWDSSNQAHGHITTYYPNNTDAWWYKINGEYKSIAVTAKNYLPMEDSAEQTGNIGYSFVLAMTLDNGSVYAFRIINEKEASTGNIRYIYTRYGASGSVTGWGGWCELEAKAPGVTDKLQGDGAEFSLTRTDASTLQITLDGVVLDTYTMDGVTADNKVVNVGMYHYGNSGEYIDIPFVLTKEPTADQVQFDSAQLSNYRIVYDDSVANYRSLALQLQAAIAENYGVTLSVLSDSGSTPGDYEILLGDTNRYDYQGRFMEYSVTVSDGAFRINVGGAYSAEAAVNYLCENVFTGQTLALGSGIYYSKSLLTASRAVTDGTTARVMSANILASAFDSGAKPAYYRAEILAGMLVSYQPDVVGLQEVDASWSSVLDGYLKKLEAVYGITYSRLLGSYDGKTNYTCFLYRFDKFTVENSGVTPFSWWIDPVFNHSYHMRNISWGQFVSKTDSTKKFVVANTHWSYRTEHDSGTVYLSDSTKAITTNQLRTECKNETNTLMTQLKSTYSTMPVFLTGDFNTTKSYFNSYGWSISGYSFIKSGNLDHIFGTGSYTVKTTGSISNVNEHGTLSDHSFIYADLAF